MRYYLGRFLSFAVFGICAILPLYIFKFKILGVPTTFLEISILLLFIIWFFEKANVTKKWFKFFYFDDFSLPIEFFLLVAIFSSLSSFNTNGALGILKAYFFEPVLLFMVVRDRIKLGDGKFVFSGLIVAATWLACFAIFQRLTGLGFPEYAANEISQGRVVSVYNSANSLALFLGPILALCFGWILARDKANKNQFFLVVVIVSLLLQFIAIFLTKSQAGIIATILVLGFIFLTNFFPFRINLILFKFLTVSALALIVLFPLIAYFGVNFGALLGDVTLQNRSYLWRGAIALVRDKPLTGAGLAGFRGFYGANYHLPGYDELLQYPHNLILNFWTETGFFGVIGFFWLLFNFFSKSLKNEYFRISLLGVILYILVHGIVDVPYFKNDLSAEFFVILALSGFSLKVGKK